MITNSRSAVDVFALVLGVFLLIEGMWGLTTDVVFGVLTTNRIHAIIHIVLGLIALVTGWQGRRVASAFFSAFCCLRSACCGSCQAPVTSSFSFSTSTSRSRG